METTKATYSFTLTLASVTELTPAMDDALFEAGCDDATPGSCDGRGHRRLRPGGQSLGDAIGSAVKDVERAGDAVARVEVEARST